MVYLSYKTPPDASSGKIVLVYHIRAARPLIRMSNTNNTDVKLYRIQSGEGLYCPARKEADGVAKAALRLTDTAGQSKTWRDDAIKIGISIRGGDF